MDHQYRYRRLANLAIDAIMKSAFLEIICVAIDSQYHIPCRPGSRVILRNDRGDYHVVIENKTYDLWDLSKGLDQTAMVLEIKIRGKHILLYTTTPAAPEYSPEEIKAKALHEAKRKGYLRAIRLEELEELV